MKKKMKHYAKEIIYFVIVMTVLANIISFYRSQDLSHAPLSIKTFKLIDNSRYTLPQNKPILIHFWATWCPTCKLEAANINFLSKYFEVITIAENAQSDYELKKYMDEHGYTFKVVNDKDGTLREQFHVIGFPTTFIFDKNKELLFSEVGYTSTPGLYLRMLWAAR